MKNYKLLTGAILFVLIVTQSCRKDSFEKITTGEPNVVYNIEVKVNGTVLNEESEPVSEALVTLGSTQVLTNTSGIFSIKGLANSEHGFLVVSKNGYFDAFPSFYSTKKGDPQIEVILLSNKETKRISATTGGRVITTEGASVSFAAAGFSQGGQPYNGSVLVSIVYLDPTREKIDNIMPGDLSAINEDGDERLLRSFGMMKVEIQDENGQHLQLSKPAKLTFPVPSSLLSEAPSEIPMWYFDEEIGKWREEGMGRLEGDKYMASVNHFTFWNCDAPYEFINISGKISANGNGVKSLVCVINEDNNDQRCMSTTNSGHYSGKVPKGVPLKLTISGCQSALLKKDLGILDQDDEFNFSIPPWSTSDEVYRIFGNVVTCDGKPVENGRVHIHISKLFFNESETIFLQSDGSFNAIINFNCAQSEFTKIAVYANDHDRPYLTNICHDIPTVLNGEINCGTLDVCYQDYPSSALIKLSDGREIRYNLNSLVTNRGGESIVALPYIIGMDEQLRITFYGHTTDNWWYTSEFQNGSTWSIKDDGEIVVHLYDGECNPTIVEILNVTIVDKVANITYPGSSIYFDSYTFTF